ncbi:MAG TPA: 2-amino-4-hydroxy-6-hydroxymethyldihydropteridine diphosphokinase, partial [Gaiellaceae bacterium]|nr:2-amino-4-hydroxy-6-hydroxymethyldihydropteridine diphosphokinase [Gaiellaceae bacterium]
MAERATAYLGLGSNLGDRHAHLDAARAALEQRGIRVRRVSRRYETEPVGGPSDQPWFLNEVLEIDTDVDPEALLRVCLDVEASIGRVREDAERWGPRTIDIDVLVYGSVRHDSPTLTVPHPRIAARAFVLAPLVELAPDLEVPGLGRADQLLRRCGDP